MGKRGPLANGQKRTLGKILDTGEYIPAYDDMTVESKEIWLSIVQSYPANAFNCADRPQLRVFCEAVEMSQLAKKHLDTDGYVLDTPKGPKISPWLQVWDKAQQSMRSSAVKLRISRSTQVTPENAGRERIDMQEKATVNDIDSFILQPRIN